MNKFRQVSVEEGGGSNVVGVLSLLSLVNRQTDIQI